MIKKAISVLLVNTLLLGQAQSLQNNIETVAVFDFTANSVVLVLPKRYQIV